MSTVHHHPAHPHVWLYAAAAVAAGFVAVLVITVFATSSGAGDTSPGGTGGSNVTQYHGPMFRQICFAMRPGDTIELAHSGCNTSAP
jgi:hypothetical protein